MTFWHKVEDLDRNWCRPTHGTGSGKRIIINHCNHYCVNSSLQCINWNIFNIFLFCFYFKCSELLLNKSAVFSRARHETLERFHRFKIIRINVPHDLCIGDSISHLLIPCLSACLAKCLNSVLSVKALVGAFNQGSRGLLRDCPTLGQLATISSPQPPTCNWHAPVCLAYIF